MLKAILVALELFGKKNLSGEKPSIRLPVGKSVKHFLESCHGEVQVTVGDANPGKVVLSCI